MAGAVVKCVMLYTYHNSSCETGWLQPVVVVVARETKRKGRRRKIRKEGGWEDRLVEHL